MDLGPRSAATGIGSGLQRHEGTLVPAAPHFSPDRASVPRENDRSTNRRVLAPSDHALTVVVPAYNEEQRLPATLDGLAAYLDTWGVDYRVLVVDDGSSDRTASLTAGRGPRFDTVSQRNGGKGSAVRRGMLQATGRVVAFTDADLPYDLDALRTAEGLLARQECQVVFGARDLRESTVRVPRRVLRTLAHLTFKSIVRHLVSRQVTDTQCGLKVFSRQAALEIFARTTIDGFAFDAEVVLLTHFLGLSFRRIPVTLINEYASTISLSRHAAAMLQDVFRARLRAWGGGYLPAGAIQFEIEQVAAHEFRSAAA